MNKFRLSAFMVYVLMTAAGCKGTNASECSSTSEVSEEYEVIENGFVMTAPVLDSLSTHKIMEECLWKEYIDVPENTYHKTIPHVYASTNLEHLPYYMINFGEAVNKYDNRNYNLLDEFIKVCTGAIDDPELYKFGKRCVKIINDNEKKKGSKVVTRKDGKEITIQPNHYPYPASFTPAQVHRDYTYADFSLTDIDKFRVKALLYNDRKALSKLEQYYKKKGDDTGIAIYYKVMLAYEGNGDLAEKFYKVLEPHFNETPGFRKAVREVLLRAAHCDNNRRAQELCDSLGFSLCDYRLPLPADSDTSNHPLKEMKFD